MDERGQLKALVDDMDDEELIAARSTYWASSGGALFRFEPGLASLDRIVRITGED